MTFDELQSRIAGGDKIGRTIDLHDAIVAIAHELQRLRMGRGGEGESTEEAWEHTDEEYPEALKP